MTAARFVLPVLACAALLPGGCASMSNTGKGVVGGSLIGSAIGTGVGIATGDPLAGAAIGGLGGAAVGGAIGSVKDDQDAERAEGSARAQAATARALSIEDVKQLAQPDANGKVVSDEVIIGYIRSGGNSYSLSAQDIKGLSAAGVSDRVINAMMTARPAPLVVREPGPRTVVVRDPYYDPFYGPPVVYVRPPPPPIGVGFTYHHYQGRRW